MPATSADNDQSFAANKSYYETELQVRLYREAEGLQPAEHSIAQMLGTRMPTMDMLDLGIGGGRTTKFFLPRVHRYLGVDISRAMIEACRQEFPDCRLEVADASDLDHLDSGSFDFILFSFNGIDYLSTEGRDRALRGFSRLLKAGGILAFSSHNTRFIPALYRRFRPTIGGGLRATLGRVKGYMHFLRKNGLRAATPAADYRVIFEGNHGFAAPTLYVRPEHQVEMLRRIGFADVTVFDSVTGRETPPMSPSQPVISPWVYYLCHKISVSPDD
jgi:SAM-dependent methyltransferase